jgi:hypothetical protein
MKSGAIGPESRFYQITIPSGQLEAGVYSPTNELVPWGVIATLRPRASVLADRLGIQLQQSFDDVDALSLAVLETPSGNRVALVDRLRAPVPATEVHANVQDPTAARRLLDALLAALDLDADSVMWWRYPR